MIKPPRPLDETERLEDVRALGLLDTHSEERFDRLTRIASRVFDVSIAYVALIDTDRQWFKSSCGLGDMTGTDRDVSFCGHTILQDDLLVIEDAAEDPRFFDNPLVTGPIGLRFYAGHPLIGPQGHNVGTFCIADSRPRTLSEEDRLILRDLAGIAAEQASNVELAATLNRLATATGEVRRLRDENVRLTGLASRAASAPAGSDS